MFITPEAAAVFWPIAAVVCVCALVAIIIIATGGHEDDIDDV